MTDDLTKRLLEHADWCDANEWEIPITLGDDLRAAAERIKAMAAENAARWISVEDELPETESDVLTCDANRVYRLCAYGETDAFWRYDEKDNVWARVKGVTHWMPLPEPPKEDE